MSSKLISIFFILLIFEISMHSYIISSTFQVVKNGHMVPEMVQVKNENEFAHPNLVPSLRYILQTFEKAYQSAAYLELNRRTNEESKAITNKDDKIRKMSFFTKFS